jgi:Leucine-rich repeat (LRR) protein
VYDAAMKTVLIVAGALLIIGLIWWSMNLTTTTDIQPTPQKQATTSTTTNTPTQQSSSTATTTVNLSGKNLTSVDMDIFNQITLTSLDLSNNNLSGSLPAEIGKLTNLRTLNLSRPQKQQYYWSSTRTRKLVQPYRT